MKLEPFSYKFQNQSLISFDPIYEFMVLEKIFFPNGSPWQHPLNKFYFHSHNLSINAKISLKWAIWGYIFFENIKNFKDMIVVQF